MSGRERDGRGAATAWFFRLGLTERVRLLDDPGAELSPGLVRALGADAQRVTRAVQGGGRCLREDAAALLAERRDGLLSWWKSLPADEQDFLLAHRRAALPESYRHVMAASGTLLTELHEGESGPEVRVLLTPMTRTFLEWQAGNGSFH